MSDLIEKARAENSEETLVRALNFFRCSMDHDIESFLYEKAIKYNDDDVCRTYIIVDEEKFFCGVVCIVAYFTLSHRAIVFDKGSIKDNG